MKISRFDIMDALLYSERELNHRMYSELIFIIDKTNPKDDYVYIFDEEVINFINEALSYRYDKNKEYNNILDYYDDVAKKNQDNIKRDIVNKVKAKIKKRNKK